MKCPGCGASKGKAHYLCRECWYKLTSVTRNRLWKRDRLAGTRLIELHHAIADGIPLEEIQVSP